MIYINYDGKREGGGEADYDGPESPMLHTCTKFRLNRSTDSEKDVFFKVLAIYSNGGHLGHVT